MIPKSTLPTISGNRAVLADARIPAHSAKTDAWPRLVADNNDFARIRSQLDSDPLFRKRYLPAEDHPDLHVTRTDSAFKPGGRMNAYEIIGGTWMAFLHRVTGEPKYMEAARRYLPLIAAAEKTPLRPAIDATSSDLMQGHWFLAVTLIYDFLRDTLAEADVLTLRSALCVQARSAYRYFLELEDWRYEQNHTYIPMAGLGLAGLVLLGEEPEAEAWAGLARESMRRTGNVLCPDGYYYEGISYYAYAYHWNVIFAGALLRVTGENWFSRPPFQNVETFVLHHLLPGGDRVFDWGDWGPRQGQQGYEAQWHTHPSYLNVWSLLGLRAFRGTSPALEAALRWTQTGPEQMLDLPLFSMLWENGFPVEKPTPPTDGDEALPTHHYFPDHDAVFWRTSWSDPDATALMVKCGPPEGHAATEHLRQLPEWVMNSGHTHPDAGQFLLWSRGVWLAGDTGYTCTKWTRDHNSILIDGQGQFRDGRYHAYDGVDYRQLDKIRMEDVRLSDREVELTCVLEAAYDTALWVQRLRRHVRFVESRYLVIQDEATGRDPHAFHFLWHADHEPIALDHNRWLIRNGRASVVLQAFGEGVETKVEQAVVPAYTGFPDIDPDFRPRGWRLEFVSEPTRNYKLAIAAVVNPDDPAVVRMEMINGARISFADETDRVRIVG